MSLFTQKISGELESSEAKPGIHRLFDCAAKAWLGSVRTMLVNLELVKMAA